MLFLAAFTVPSPQSEPLEISGAGYRRVEIEFDAAGRNVQAAVFPTAVGHWGRVDRLAVTDASGNELCAGECSPPVMIAAGDILNIPVGALFMSACGLSAAKAPAAEPETADYLVFSDADLIPGTPVYLTSAGHLAQAAALSLQTAQAVGLSTAQTGAGDTGAYTADGRITRADWSAITGTVTLTVGQMYYLSDVPGKLQSAPPASGYQLGMGRAVYPDTLDVELGELIQL